MPNNAIGVNRLRLVAQLAVVSPRQGRGEYLRHGLSFCPIIAPFFCLTSSLTEVAFERVPIVRGFAGVERFASDFPVEFSFVVHTYNRLTKQWSQRRVLCVCFIHKGIHIAAFGICQAILGHLCPSFKRSLFNKGAFCPFGVVVS